MKKIMTFLVVLSICFFIPNYILAGELNIVGTGDGVKILKAIGQAFTQANPEITITVPKSIGSGGGIKAVGNGQEKIGRVARPIKDKDKPYGLAYVPYAKSPVVFFTHKSVGVKNLSADQVCDIYSGKITNWKGVGGTDAKIRVVRREDGDSSLKVLKTSLPGFDKVSITSKSKTALNTPEVFSVVEGKENTIGFGPYDVSLDANVNIISIDGKKPTDSSYPSFGTLALIYKESNLNEDIKAFVAFATSSAASGTIVNAGGLPFK